MRKKGRKPKKGWSETMTQREILDNMDIRGLNPSISRVTAGRTVIYSRENRY